MTTFSSFFTKSSFLKTRLATFFTFLFAFYFLGVIDANSQSTKEYKTANDTLIVYSSIPNLPEFVPKIETSEKQNIRTSSDKFTIRVRSAASNNEWVDVFAHYTYSRALEILDLSMLSDNPGNNSPTSVQNYPNATAGWSHTYGNIEMSRNQAVEVEISLKNGFKIDGQDIIKATVHPAHKASKATIVNGKVYFKITEPVQVAIDINGQFDDHNAFVNPVAKPTDGVSSFTVPLHAITFFANPVIKKPSLTNSKTFYVNNGVMPTNSNYDTLYFLPGVHLIGMGNKIYPGKTIYIPGDALIYGNMNNDGVPLNGFSKIGENISIFGYGTISGAKIKHPAYVANQTIHEPINISNAKNYKIQGITIADGAHFSLWTPGSTGGSVSYVKVIGWRANGDGLGNGDQVNDCFVRTNDDASYVRGNKKRCTFWKDNISAIFFMAAVWTAPILIEDIDVLYCRSRGANGAAFDVRGNANWGVATTQVTFRNFRFHDKLGNMRIFSLDACEGGTNGGSYSSVKWENISIASCSVKQVIYGCAGAPWDGSLTFENVTFAGTTLTQANFSTYFNTNAYVKNISFGTPVNYTVTLNVKGSGTVLGGGTYSPNKPLTISAKAAAGFIFDNWTEGAEIISSDSVFTFNVLKSRTLTANFIPFTGTTYTITTSSSPSSAGTTTGNGVYRDGQLISVSAIANSCNTFVNWTENGVAVSTDASYAFKVTSNRNLVANFSTKSFTVNVVTPEGGTVTGDLTYNCNQTINVTAAPNTDYKFDGWYANDVLVSTNLVSTLNTGNALQIKAKFSSLTGVNYIDGSTITYYAPNMNSTTFDAAKNVSIGKVATSPVIDGKDDEQIWQNAPLFSGQTIGKGAAEEYVLNNADAQLSWKATWDATALYVVLKVKDDVLVWNDANSGWNIDALEFYVTKDAIVTAETGNNLARTTNAKVLWQNLYLASVAGRAIMEFRGIDNTSLSGTKTPVDGTSAARSYDEASKTTTFEIRYEWTKILTGTNAFTSVAENDKIRIGMMFNDNDNAAANTRDHKVYYVEKAEPNSALAYKDFAVVTLKNVVVGLKEQKASDLAIYPNPASGMVMFSKVIDADFYNLTGQKVLSVKNSSKADISSLSKGIYQVKVNNGFNYKLVVN